MGDQGKRIFQLGLKDKQQFSLLKNREGDVFVCLFVMRKVILGTEAKEQKMRYKRKHGFSQKLQCNIWLEYKVHQGKGWKVSLEFGEEDHCP